MSLPTIHINITASMVAAYAAVISTLTGAVQLFNFLRGRSRIRISVRRDQMIMGDPKYANQTLTIVTVANAGRRPVTITTVGARCLFPDAHFIIVNSNPPLPHELTEGKYLMAITIEDDLDFSRIQSWEASDATGRSHLLHVASWQKRYISNKSLRRKWKEEAKAKAAGAKS